MIQPDSTPIPTEGGLSSVLETIHSARRTLRETVIGDSELVAIASLEAATDVLIILSLAVVGAVTVLTPVVEPSHPL